MGHPDDDRRIQELRRRIDDVDQRILDLLSERSRCALEIGEIKRRVGLALYDPEREASIVSQVVRANRGPLPAEAVRRLFERILDESRSAERIAAGRGRGPERKD
ncbi:MAG TPA: chorismate mutase [Candidatus Polarisedimenticolia bacterium]|nr:chorismate mutase [Candidatus Polarisedimenticolia bacterium]